MNPVSLLQQYTESYVPSLPKVSLTVKKVQKLALGSFAILAVSNIPGASAGIALEIACMAACTAAAYTPVGAVWWGTCMQTCTLLGFAPTP